jgi:putative acetyltransferase
MNEPLVAAKIRRACPEDGAAVRRFVFATFDEYGIDADPEGLDKDVMSFGEHPDPVDAYVAEIDGVAVGSVMVSPHVDGNGWLSKFFVDRAYRGRGVGRALLLHAIESARTRGYRRLELDTRAFFKEAVHLYEATGWTRSDKVPQSGPCDAIYYLDL